MTTSTLDRIPLDEITAQARQARPARTVLTVVAALLFGVGWVAARVCGVAWLGVMWAGVAVREGWRSSHGPSRNTRIAKLEAEREELLTRLSRFSG